MSPSLLVFYCCSAYSFSLLCLLKSNPSEYFFMKFSFGFSLSSPRTFSSYVGFSYFYSIGAYLVLLVLVPSVQSSFFCGALCFCCCLSCFVSAVSVSSLAIMAGSWSTYCSFSGSSSGYSMMLNTLTNSTLNFT